MRCKRCGDIASWHDWKQKPFCSPHCEGSFVVEIRSAPSQRSDPDRIIHENGVAKLEKTHEGRVVLNNARKKWAAELVQPGDPEFNKLYGKQVRERQEARRELQEQSKKMWEAAGGRHTKILHED